MNIEEKRLRFWKQFSGELRTPLNVIKGVSDVWKSDIYDIDAIKSAFSKIEESSEVLLRMADNMVDYSAIEYNELEIKHEEFNLKEAIDTLTIMYHTKADRQGKWLEVQIHSVTNEILLGDRHRVLQILECMFRNSLLYTDANDRLYFRIAQTSGDNDKVSIRFTLTSTNRHVYDMIYKTVNEKIVTENTDIELYNCHYILTQMGGMIFARLDENEYSEIVIDMLFDKSDSNEKVQEENVFENDRILIIADLESEGRERGEQLKELKIQYDVATQEEQALDMIGEAENRGNPYCMCIIDWNMEGINLQSFIQDIHTIFGKDFLIVATAYEVEKHLVEAKKMGISYIIKKTWFRSTVYDALVRLKKGQIFIREEDKQYSDQYDFTGKKVMVADDVALNMDVIVKILSKVGIDTYCAHDGQEALNLFLEKPDGFFDCILMDVNMPVMNGYDAVRAIRSCNKKDAKSVPIFALTANAFQSDIRAALNSGMDGHFAKPINVENLYSTLQRVFADREKGTYEYRNKISEIVDGMDKESIYRDPLTGLMNRAGLEKKINTMLYIKKSLVLMVLGIDSFEQVVAQYGAETGDRILIKVADCLQAKFRNTDIFVRISADGFCGILNNFSGSTDYIEHKMNEINSCLLKAEDDLPGISLSAGIVYSKRGYSSQLFHTAEDLYYEVRSQGVCNWQIKNDEQEQNQNAVLDVLGFHSLYGTGVYYLENDNGVLLDQKEDYINMILGNNQAVGIITGFYEPGLPIYAISSFALENLGYDYDSMMAATGGELEKLLCPDDREYFHNGIQDKDIATRKIRFIHKNGDIIWMNETHINISNSDGRKLWMISLRVIDEYMVGNMCDMDYEIVSLIYCEDDMILFEKVSDRSGFNLVKRKKYNYSSLFQNEISKLIIENERESFIEKTKMSELKHNLETKGIYEFIVYHMIDGISKAVRYKFRYFDSKKDSILLTQEYMVRFAESDDITELWNAKGFEINLRELLEKKSLNEMKYSLLYFNIKGFKAWNELLGHANANELLKQIAAIIQNSRLQPLIGGRSNADNFWFVVKREMLVFDEITALCHRKVKVNGSDVAIRMRCGIYHIDDKTQEISIMCDKATIAETHITNEFATPYFVYDNSVEEEYTNQFFVLNNLERAFKKGEFKVYYQPVFDVVTKKVVSAEALIRWQQVGDRIISPGVFIPVLEKKGSISQLDMFVEREVQKFLEKRAEDGLHYVPVSMNLSRMDFLNEKFMNELRENVEQTTINHKYLRFEVTESAYIGVGQGGNILLDGLREQGSLIYIDDFGTGYSSLQNLLEIEFDVLKLDMIFIRNIGKNQMSEEIIKSAIDISHHLGKKVIAEGAETEEHFQFLKNAGCDYIQGFYFSAPLSEENFAKLLEQN